VVQGVGFRPFVFRLASQHGVAGWVLNGDDGVEIFAEGPDPAIELFLHLLRSDAPPAAQITAIEVRVETPEGLTDFAIRESARGQAPSVRISPDLPVCDACLREVFDPANHRYKYPYINCTNCGPRYTVILGLPYDRAFTTMKNWGMDEFCARQYADALDRRFHAQPLCCPACGPNFHLRVGDEIVSGNEASIAKAAQLLREGKIVGVKGLGGYHLACAADNAVAVEALRSRKYRKEKPFALMVRSVADAKHLVELSAEAEALLTSIGRPIVLAPAKSGFRGTANLAVGPDPPVISSPNADSLPSARQLPGIAPDNDELGVMLPYTPLHYLLFDAGAPSTLVMTSANRSSEPIAYDDRTAVEQLAGIADAILVGERPIARRVDDSVARAGHFGPIVLRRGRGYAPGAVTTFPTERPILALGADLKNAITLVVGGQAFVSQHIGDLDHFECLQAFRETIDDLAGMYEVRRDDLLVVHDSHPQYVGTQDAATLECAERRGVQHHRAHIASVLAERKEWRRRVLGLSFDGTGYGDDGTIWGGEFFAGSIADGFTRVAHLRPAALAGGDAAARYPVQAAAGFLAQLEDLPDMSQDPFDFGDRYRAAAELVRKNVRTFSTTSMGRLFDAAAALLGFTRGVTFEGQAAQWFEHLAHGRQESDPLEPYPFPFAGDELDFRPLLHATAADRARGRSRQEIAYAFHLGVAHGVARASAQLAETHNVDAVVLSGGVFQNELLLGMLKSLSEPTSLPIWTNHAVPPNDGGISLGQAALAAFGQFN
jgi:hydrogenase maturation protein HypF